MKNWLRYSVLLLATALLAGVRARARRSSFKDPTGDDKGPGNYIYPTDKVYKAGSFDLTEFKMKVSGDKADVLRRRQLARSRTRGAWAAASPSRWSSSSSRPTTRKGAASRRASPA